MKHSRIRTKYQGIIDVIHKGAIENFNRDGNLCPVIFLITFDGRPIPVMGAIDYSDSDQKEMLSKAVRKLATEHKAVGAIFCTEAWALLKHSKKKTADELTEEVRKTKGVRNHPDRVEVIQIMEQYLDGSYSTSHEIVRDGEKATIKKGETTDVEDIGGIFLNLLNKPNIDELLEEAMGR